MGNIAESATWHETIYQIERNDPVGGGAEGVANKAPKQLADRTAYLKKELETNKDDIGRALAFTTDKQNYQANNKTIEELAEPVNGKDAVNKVYCDQGDGELQNQINDIKSNASWGWELIGNFQEGCEIIKRNHIVFDEDSNKYYNWVGELPHLVLAATSIETEIENGNPWVLVTNSDELTTEVARVARIAEMASNKIDAAHLPESLSGQASKMLAVNQTEDGYQFIQSLSAFYGFRKNGAKLIIETGDGNYNATEFNEWFISGTGATFSIDDNGNLLINL